MCEVLDNIIAEGKNEEKMDIIKIMIGKYPNEDIAYISGLSIAEIEDIKKYCTISIKYVIPMRPFQNLLKISFFSKIKIWVLQPEIGSKAPTRQVCYFVFFNSAGVSFFLVKAYSNTKYLSTESSQLFGVMFLFYLFKRL